MRIREAQKHTDDKDPDADSEHLVDYHHSSKIKSVHYHHSSEIKSRKEVTKQQNSRFFLAFFA